MRCCTPAHCTLLRHASQVAHRGVRGSSTAWCVKVPKVGCKDSKASMKGWWMAPHTHPCIIGSCMEPQQQKPQTSPTQNYWGPKLTNLRTEAMLRQCSTMLRVYPSTCTAKHDQVPLESCKSFQHCTNSSPIIYPQSACAAVTQPMPLQNGVYSTVVHGVRGVFDVQHHS